MERFKDVDMSALLERADMTCNGSWIPPKDYPIGLSEEQAEAIVQMRLGALTGLERQKITDELFALCEKIIDLRDILGDRRRSTRSFPRDLEEIRRKFGDERRTTIENVSGEMDIEDLIPVEDCVVTYTNFGYIKRTTLDEYKTQKRGGRGVTGMKQREDDFVEEMFICSTHDHVLFFITNRGYMFDLKCYEIPMDGSRIPRDSISQIC